MAHTLTVTEYEAELQRASAAVHALLDDLTAAQCNWQPEGGRAWSVGQCVAHLTLTNRDYVRAIDAAAATARPRADRAPGIPNRLGRWFIGALEPPVKLRVKAPHNLQPASALDPVAVGREFDASVAELRAALDRAWGVELSRVRFRNPIAFGLPTFNLAAGFLIMAAHMRRHTVQANAVRARAAFPSR